MNNLTGKADELIDAGKSQETPAQGAWTRRRFLGALVASAVAAGVKIPGFPAADMVEFPHRLYVNPGHDYYLIIHPNVLRDLERWPAIDPDDLDPDTHEGEAYDPGQPPRIEVVTGHAIATGRYEGVRLLEGDALDATVRAMREGHIRPAPLATPLPPLSA